MEDKGKLHDLFNSIDSTTDDPAMDWASIGPEINKALDAKKKKKRRLLLFWFFGMTSLVAFVLTLTLVNTEGKTHHNSTATTLPTTSISDQPKFAALPQRSQVLEQTNLDLGTSTEDEAVKKNRIQVIPGSPSINKRNQLPTKSTSSSQIIHDSNIEDQSKSPMPLQSEQPSESVIKWNLTSPSNPPMVLGYLNTEIINPLTHSAPNINVPQLTLAPTIEQIDRLDTKLEVGVYGGITNNQLHNSYANAKELVSSNIEIGVTVPIYNSIYIAVGLGLDQQRFQTEFVDQQNINIYKPKTPDTIYYYGNNTEVIYKDSIGGISTRRFGYTNKITSFSIPLEVQYRVQLKNLTVSAQTGIALDMHQAVDLQTADEDFLISSRANKSSFSFSPRFVAALSTHVPLSKRLTLGARYRLTFQSLHKSISVERQSFTTHGVQLGLRYSMR